MMDPKIAQRKALDAAKATVEGLAETRQALAALVATVKQLERKIEALARMVKPRGK